MRDQSTIDKLSQFFRGDRDAVELALMFVHICDVWDDLIEDDTFKKLSAQVLHMVRSA